MVMIKHYCSHCGDEAELILCHDPDHHCCSAEECFNDWHEAVYVCNTCGVHLEDSQITSNGVESEDGVGLWYSRQFLDTVNRRLMTPLTGCRGDSNG